MSIAKITLIGEHQQTDQFLNDLWTAVWIVQTCPNILYDDGAFQLLFSRSRSAVHARPAKQTSAHPNWCSSSSFSRPLCSPIGLGLHRRTNCTHLHTAFTWHCSSNKVLQDITIIALALLLCFDHLEFGWIFDDSRNIHHFVDSTHGKAKQKIPNTHGLRRIPEKDKQLPCLTCRRTWAALKMGAVPPVA